MNLVATASSPRAPPSAAPPVRLLVCGPEPRSGAAFDPVSALKACGWRHDRIEVSYARLPADPDAAFERVRAGLEETGASGVLLLSLSSDEEAEAGFVVRMRACNRRARGLRGAEGERRIAPTGPASARATAPVAELARAICATGALALASSDAADDAANHLLYRLLAEAAPDVGAPAVGAVRAPTASSGCDPGALERGLCAALFAFADTLHPCAPPQRATA